MQNFPYELKYLFAYAKCSRENLNKNWFKNLKYTYLLLYLNS